MKKIKRIKYAGFLCLAILAGCGGANNDDSSSGGSQQGEVIIGITDAPGDFTTYQVDVQSLRLQRQDGLEVETLPQKTTIDFSDYVDLTEFLTAATVPNGVYVSGSMTLDYSNAVILVEDPDGIVVPATGIVDADGAPVSILDVEVNLDNANRLVVVPGVPAHITLDFDLNASNTVYFAGDADINVVVEPILLASLERTGAKTHRARGGLRSVDVANSRYSIILRPFRHRFENSDRFGHLLVQTDGDTLFEINGQSRVGLEGLALLADQPALTATVARGFFRVNPVRFVASEVRAGTSVPGGDQDILTGSVIKRVGDVFTVKGAKLIRSEGSVVYNDTIDLTASSNTTIRRQGWAEAASLIDVSVGQRVSAAGRLVLADDGSYSMDSTEGSIRLLYTHLNGVVVDNTVGLVLDLSSIDRRLPQVFDFTGTGVSSEYDADPDAYEVDANGLGTDSLASGTAVKVFGHVNSFGLAPADFVARTLADASVLPAVLRISWQNANEASLDTSLRNALLLNLDAVGRFHHVSQAGVKIDLLETDSKPTVTLHVDGAYVLVQDRKRQLHTDVSSFIADLDTRIAQGSVPVMIEASGNYDSTSITMTGRRVVIYLR